MLVYNLTISRAYGPECKIIDVENDFNILITISIFVMKEIQLKWRTAYFFESFFLKD